MTKTHLLINTLSILTLILCGFLSRNIDVPVADLHAQASANTALLCHDAGADAYVCGFQYELQGSDITGQWSVLCSRSDGLVIFDDAFQDTTVVRVTNCGKYEFVYEVPSGPCQGLDTIVVIFEDPSNVTTTTAVDMLLDLEAECHAESTTVDCENIISITGVIPPSLKWSICAEATCEASIFITDFSPSPDSCVASLIVYNEDMVSDSDSECASAADIGSIDLLDIITTLLSNLSITCPPVNKCYPPPPECFETIYDTSYISVPTIDGGQWNYIDDNGNLVPLDDTTLLIIDGVPYAFVVEPGSDYNGPGDIDFILWEISNTGEWISPSNIVDLNLQWVINYVYDKLEIIQPLIVLKDSCLALACGDTIIIPTEFTIPTPPELPCNPVVLTYNNGPDDVFYTMELNCAVPADFGPTCEGELEFFDQAGVYFFTCVSIDGCPYNAIVDVLENFETPVISDIVTTCDSDLLNYSVSFVVSGGNGIYDIVGVGQTAQGETAVITGISECTEFTIQVTDAISFCPTEAVVVQCCECTSTSSTISAEICDGEVYDFFGQLITAAGEYVSTIQNVQGCDSIITLTLVINQGSEVNINASICDGNGYNFYGQILTNGGLYSDTTVNAQGCFDIEILLLEVLSPDTNNVYARICEGDIYDFYGQSLISGGVYTETLLNQYGCDSIIKLQLNLNTLDFQLSSEADCSEGESGIITVSEMQGERAPFSFSIDNVEFVSSAIFENLDAAEYTVYMRDLDGCIVAHDIDVPEVAPIFIDLEDTYILCGNAYLQIDLTPFINSTDSITISWDDGSVLASRTFGEAGSYWVELSNTCEQIRKEFAIEFEEAAPGSEIYVPNVFTPNGDGINDEFKVYVGAPITEFEFHIYDRWGDNLREFYSTDEAWDGSFLGQEMIPAVYVWWLRAKVEACDGTLSEVLLKGDVTLLR